MKLQSHQMPEPSDDEISQLPDEIQDYIGALESDLEETEEAIQCAYGYLWRGMSAGPHEQDARRRLLSIMDKEDQRHGIDAALAKYGPTTTHEVLMKCP